MVERAVEPGLGEHLEEAKNCKNCERMYDPFGWCQIRCKVCNKELTCPQDIYVHHTLCSFKYNNQSYVNRFWKPDETKASQIQPIQEKKKVKPKAKRTVSKKRVKEEIEDTSEDETNWEENNMAWEDQSDGGENDRKDEMTLGEKENEDAIETRPAFIDSLLSSIDEQLNKPKLRVYLSENNERSRQIPMIEKVKTSIKIEPNAELNNYTRNKESFSTSSKSNNLVFKPEEQFSAFIQCPSCDLLFSTTDLLLDHKISNHKSYLGDELPLQIKPFGEVEPELLSDENCYQSGEEESEEGSQDTEFINEKCRQIRAQMREIVKKCKYKISDNEDDVTCKICGKKFWSKRYLNSCHMLTHKDEEAKKEDKVVCDECGVVFENKHIYHSHKSLVHQKEKKKCNVCNVFGSWTRKEMSKHRKAVHDVTWSFGQGLVFKEGLKFSDKMLTLTDLVPVQYECTFCRVRLDNKYDMQTHIYTAHEDETRPNELNHFKKGRNVLTCLFCSHEEKFVTQMHSHIYFNHQDEFWKSIPYSQRSGYRRRFLYRSNKFTQVGDKFSCDYCKYEFTQKHTVQNHIMKNHESHLKENQKRFRKCEECSFTTLEAGSLARHVRHVHRKVKYPNRRKVSDMEKKHVCHICSFRALHDHVLQYHINSVHLGNKPRKTANKRKRNALYD